MSQKSYLLNPWVWGLTTSLLVGAAYGPHFLQWYSQPAATNNDLSTPYVIAVSQSPTVDRKAYFSSQVIASSQIDVDSRPEVDQQVSQSAPQDFQPAGQVQSLQTMPPVSSNSAPTQTVQEPKAAQNTPEKRALETVKDKSKPPLADALNPSQTVTIDELIGGLVLIEYPKEVVVEFETSKFSKGLMRQLLTRMILSANPLDPVSLLNATLQKQPIDFRRTPQFYQRILNQAKQPLRYPAQAYAYAKTLLEENVTQIEDGGVDYSQVAIPLHDLQRMVPQYVAGSKPIKLPYADEVKRFSHQFSVAEDLVYAIMEVESAFNPKAVSQSNALGLMQIKAGAAGKDVYQYIDGKPGKPNRQTLFDPKENIRIGTAYLGLLNDFYFAKVTDGAKKELLVIASYNGGLNKVFQLFGDNEAQAIEKINRLPVSQIYNRLRLHHPSEETKSYIVKVQNAQKKYRKQLS